MKPFSELSPARQASARKIDALVTEHLFDQPFNLANWRHYSTSLDNAWLVVEKMEQAFKAALMLNGTRRDVWAATFYIETVPYKGLADQPAKAICLAALKYIARRKHESEQL